MTSRWRTIGALFVLLVITAAFYWKLTISREWTFLEGPDLANVVRPWLDFEAREFHAGRFPLWDPYEWAGHTLIGQVQPGITNPLNWILFAMPLRDGHIPVTTLHWYWVLIHWLGAVFCYALCRDLQAGYTASLLGGCIFALAGFVGHTDWPQILMCSIWVPLVLLFFARVARGHRASGSAALSGAALGMAFLSGYHVVPTFTAVLLGAMWLVYVALDWRRPARWINAAIFSAVWLLVSAVQVLPAIEYAKQSLRWAGAPEPLRWGRAGALLCTRAIFARLAVGCRNRVARDLAARQSARGFRRGIAGPDSPLVPAARRLRALVRLRGGRRPAAGAWQRLPALLADLPLRAHGGEGARTGDGDRDLPGRHRRTGGAWRGCVAAFVAAGVGRHPGAGAIPCRGGL